MRGTEKVGASGSRTGAGTGAARGHAAVAASILAVTLLGGYFAASRGELGSLPGGFLISAVVLALAFWFPAMRIDSPGDVLRGGFSLLLWLLAWTLVWDLAMSGIPRTRSLFDEWWIVYPAGVVGVGLLLILHGAALRRRSRGSEEEKRGDDGDRNADA